MYNYESSRVFTVYGNCVTGFVKIIRFEGNKPITTKYKEQVLSVQQRKRYSQFNNSCENTHDITNNDGAIIL